MPSQGSSMELFFCDPKPNAALERGAPAIVVFCGNGMGFLIFGRGPEAYTDGNYPTNRFSQIMA